ncbi:hypothetical protein HF638_02670 [Paenibacillus sp. SZ31]|uniref:hypothetical protein n=1 Tax=Paenibacillus sp. SZ31 TaxID=2725555 RepID=UPI00146C9DFC|nr:hypothetical protein [Paenibacillus sp. SZ31]NMI02859.1 hypothetical protein [Paenibacillus sp. SZ31]
MAVPATTGVLRSNISDMEIGDYIVWRYDSSGEQFIDGTLGINEIPVNGLVGTTSLNNYYWYAIKVDKGLLISDRIRHHTVTWDSMNANKIIEGLPKTFGGVSGIVRSISGGVGYADKDGKLSMKDLGLGAFPTINEWDEYIKNGRLGGKVKPNDDNVWHHFNVFSWAKESPAIGRWTTNAGTTLSATNTSRIVRGYESRSDNRGVAFTGSSASQNYIGFRPVFEYKEV